MAEEAKAEAFTKVKEIFGNYDLDGNGDISADELASVMSTLNPRFTHENCRKMFERMDTNGDGYLQYTEFVDWISDKSTHQDSGAKLGVMMSNEQQATASEDFKRKLRGKFARLDKNGDGVLNFTEVYDFLRKRYPGTELPDLRFLFDCSDKSHDGKVDFYELLDLLISVPRPKKGETPDFAQPIAYCIAGDGDKEVIDEATRRYEEDQKKFLGTVNDLCKELEKVGKDDAEARKIFEKKQKRARKEFARTGRL